MSRHTACKFAPKKRHKQVQLRCQLLEDRMTPTVSVFSPIGAIGDPITLPMIPALHTPGAPGSPPSNGYVEGGSSSTGTVNSTAVATDSFGDAYQTGSFSGTVQFGNITLTAKGSSDIFVAKYSSTGSLSWAEDIGGAGGTAASNWIAVDGMGNVYLTGYFLGTVNFGTQGSTHNLTSVYPGNPNAFVEKLTSLGSYSYADQIGAGGPALGTSITVDSQGNAYITGYFAGTVNFNPHGTNTFSSSDGGQNTNAFVEKLSLSGNYVWADDIGYGSNSYGEGIAVDSSGRVYSTGYFTGTGQFAPGTFSHSFESSNNGSDTNSYVSVLSSTGAYVSSYLLGYGGMTEAFGVAVDKSDNIYVTGDFSGTVNFGSTAVTSSNAGGNINAFVVKLTNSGKVSWVDDLGAGSTAYGISISVSSSGNVYTVGAFSGTGNFNPNGTSYLTASGNGTQYNGYLTELSSSGKFVTDAVFGYGASQIDVGNVVVGANGKVYINGDFMGAGVTFNTPGSGATTLSSPNSESQYLLELGGSRFSTPVIPSFPFFMAPMIPV